MHNELSTAVTSPLYSVFVFFMDAVTSEIYTLSLHDALPIWGTRCRARSGGSSWGGRLRRSRRTRSPRNIRESGGSYGSRHHLRHDAAGRRAVAGVLDEHGGEARDGATAGSPPGGRHRGGLPDLVGRGLRGDA